LLGQLRQGLKLISFPEERITAFFDELITLHEKAFESHRAAMAPDRSEPVDVDLNIDFALLPGEEVHQLEADISEDGLFPDLPESAAFWVADDESGGMDYQGAEAATAMDFSGKSEAGNVQFNGPWSPADLSTGSWVELLLNDDWVRAQLTWCSPHRTLFMFISGAGLAHSMSRRTMERLGAQNRIRLVSSGDLIDNALDAVAQTALRNELGEARQTASPAPKK